LNITQTYGTVHKYDRQYILPVSLIQLVKQCFKREHSITKALEIGCGSGSLLNEVCDKTVNKLCIDNSTSAVLLAKSRREFSNIHFHKLDALNIREIDEKFDLIVDSHLLHCLNSFDEVISYLEAVRDCLSDNGYFVIETISLDKSFVDARALDYQDYISADFKNVGRRILFDSRILEELILSIGFDIKVLKFPVGSKIIFDNSRVEAREDDPNVIQLILRKPS